MFDFFRKPVFLIIIAAALIIAGIWAYISNRNSQKSSQQAASSQTAATNTSGTTTISNLTNIDPGSVTEGVNAQLSLADTKAAEADKKLQLSAIEVNLSESMDRASGNTYYIYSSPNDKVNNWVISFSGVDTKFIRSRTPKEDYFSDVTVVNRSFLKTNYVAAIQIAEKNGGKSFREANVLTQVRLTLKNAEPKGWLYWFVNYTSQANTKTFQIDASNGSFVPSG